MRAGKPSVRCHPLGGVAERSNAAVSKTVSGLWVRRGFKSLPLRFPSPMDRSGAMSGAENRRGLREREKRDGAKVEEVDLESPLATSNALPCIAAV
jgi:hypothetical protein